MSLSGDLCFIITRMIGDALRTGINKAVDDSGITETKKYIDTTNKMKDKLQDMTGIDIDRREYNKKDQE